MAGAASNGSRLPRPRVRPPGRGLVVAAAFLLAGIAVTVGVAWACWRGSDVNRTGMPVLRRLPETASLELAAALGFTPQIGPDGIPIVHADGMTIHCGYGTTVDVLHISRVETLQRPYADAVSGLGALVRYEYFTAQRTRAGWPSQAMVGDEIGADGNELIREGRPPFPPRPAWPGFAVNTLFYAAALWLLIRGPFVPLRVIRFRRARRGLCPKCAYPMADSPVCTECGHALPTRPTG